MEHGGSVPTVTGGGSPPGDLDGLRGSADGAPSDPPVRISGDKFLKEQPDADSQRLLGA
jgi:hypothetical protein